MHGEYGVVNVWPIVKILLDGRLQVGNEALTSSIDAVVQAERGRWRCQVYRNQAENLLKCMPPMKECVLPNLLEVDTTQTLGADDRRVREEVKRIANGETRHLPPPEPVRFPTSPQEDHKSENTRYDVNNNKV